MSSVDRLMQYLKAARAGEEVPFGELVANALAQRAVRPFLALVPTIPEQTLDEHLEQLLGLVEWIRNGDEADE